MTITNQNKLDRDSTNLVNKPDVNKGNMENYIGNDQNDTNLGGQDYHYKGKEDDDDFEKLVILPVEKENIILL